MYSVFARYETDYPEASNQSSQVSCSSLFQWPWPLFCPYDCGKYRGSPACLTNEEGRRKGFVARITEPCSSGTKILNDVSGIQDGNPAYAADILAYWTFSFLSSHLHTHTHTQHIQFLIFYYRAFFRENTVEWSSSTAVEATVRATDSQHILPLWLCRDPGPMQWVQWCLKRPKLK